MNNQERLKERNARTVADAIETAKQHHAKGQHEHVIAGCLLHIVETAAQLPESERRAISDALILHAFHVAPGREVGSEAEGKRAH